MHEIGHAVPAFFLSKQVVVLRVGKKGGRVVNLGRRFKLELSWANGREGCTQYSVKETKVLARLLILSGGPLLTFAITCLSGYFLFCKYPSAVWVEVVLVSWFCTNLIAFLRSIIPMRLRPTDAFPMGPRSDGLQIYYILRGKREDCESP